MQDSAAELADVKEFRLDTEGLGHLRQAEAAIIIDHGVTMAARVQVREAETTSTTQRSTPQEVIINFGFAT